MTKLGIKESVAESMASLRNRLLLSEGKDPHKVTLPVQMTMQHYQVPKAEPVIPTVTKSPLLKKYFEESEEVEAEALAKKRERLRMYSQTIAKRVLMKESMAGVGLQDNTPIEETPIEMTGDANDPVVYGHEKANPMSLKGRIQQARAQLKELAQLSESDDLLVWERITQLHKGGMFMGLEQNLEQIRHGIEELAAKRRKGGIPSRNINPHIGEAANAAQQAAIAISKKKARGVAEDNDPCWDNYKQIGMKKKGGKSVPNCVPKKK
jgi:hypothetical protein